MTNRPTWRRHHGEELSAHVIEDVPQAYTVVVSYRSTGVVRQLPRVFTELESAKAAADDLLRREFSHRCSIESCGEWMRWTA